MFYDAKIEKPQHHIHALVKLQDGKDKTDFSYDSLPIFVVYLCNSAVSCRSYALFPHITSSDHL